MRKKQNGTIDIPESKEGIKVESLTREEKQKSRLYSNIQNTSNFDDEKKILQLVLNKKIDVPIFTKIIMSETAGLEKYTEKCKVQDYVIFATIFMVQLYRVVDFARHVYSVHSIT